MKKQKVALSQLRVKSFVTSQLEEVKAGLALIEGDSNDSGCRSVCDFYCEETDFTKPIN